MGGKDLFSVLMVYHSFLALPILMFSSALVGLNANGLEKIPSVSRLGIPGLTSMGTPASQPSRTLKSQKLGHLPQLLSERDKVAQEPELTETFLMDFSDRMVSQTNRMPLEAKVTTNGIQLNWQAPVASKVHVKTRSLLPSVEYTLYRTSTKEGSRETKLGKTRLLSWIDQSAIPGQQYKYYVAAESLSSINTDGSEARNFFGTHFITYYPNLAKQPALQTTVIPKVGVKLSWQLIPQEYIDQGQQKNVEYRVVRCEDYFTSGDCKELGRTKQTTFVDKTVNRDKFYLYEIWSGNATLKYSNNYQRWDYVFAHYQY